MTQIVPYLMDLCTADSTQCYMNAYKDYCFEQQSMVLSEKNVSLDDFVVQWTGMVAAEFGLDQATLESLYSSDDEYESDW